MTIFYKSVAGAVISVVLCIFLTKNSKDFAILILIAACCLILTAASTYLEPVFDFVQRLKRLADLDNDAIQTIITAVGVGIVTEIIGLICTDAGYASIAKALKFTSSAAILWLSIPLFESLLTLLETILVNI